MNLTRLKLVALLAAFCVAAVGCREKNEKVTLNPDGSGKRQFKVVMDPPMEMKMTVNGQSAPEPTPQEKLKGLVQTMVNAPSGIDAWEDLAFEVTKEEKYQLSGTAYFKDFARSQVETGGMRSNLTPSWSKEADGTMLLAYKGSRPRANAPATPMTDAQIDAAVAKSKTEWAQMKPMAAGFLSSLHEETTYILPGKVTSAGAFETVPGGVKLDIKGTKILEAMDKMFADDAALKAGMKAGRNPMQDGPADDQMGAALLGRPGPMTARVEGATKPLFDYDKEMNAAKAKMPEMMKKLGLSYAPIAPAPAVQGKPGQVPYAVDKRPMPQDDKPLTLLPDVKGFKRLSAQDQTTAGDTRKHYLGSYAKDGKTDESIVVSVVVLKTPADAQKELASMADESNPAHVRRGADPSYYRIPSSGEGAEMGWTRGRFFYLAQSFTGEKDLDAFMAGFAY